ncbi:MAG: hypothetical protein HRU22_00785 [Gammaproteobacteria bacterium]|nr:hypothetical protein [Gammaproteobacteria bacterium]
MFEALLVPVICIAAGCFFLITNLIRLANEDKLSHYLHHSPKAKLWVAKFGIEKVTTWSKMFFLPAGALVGAAILSVGLRALLVIFSV